MKLLLFFVLLQSLLVSAQSSNPLYSKQWGLRNTGQPLYKRTGELNLIEKKGTPGVDINWVPPQELKTKLKNDVLVAVIDSGIDFTHPEFDGILWKNPKCEEEVKEEDGKKIDPPCYGKNFIDPKISVLDDTGHGTHVTGIIVAKNNSEGVLGVITEKAKIMPLKVLNNAVVRYSHNGKLVSDMFADAVNFALDNKANVINMSFGFPRFAITDKFKKALKRAVRNDVPIIVAAGNNSKGIPVYPCKSDDVICVGALDNQGQVSEFSNYGHKVDILAPGEGIVSTNARVGGIRSELLRIEGYEVKRGTSQAAPFVTGIVAALKSMNPEMSLNEIKARIYGTSNPKSLYGNKFFNHGLINMKASLEGSVDELFIPIGKEQDTAVIQESDLSFTYNLLVEKIVSKEGSVKLEVLSPGISLISEKSVKDKTLYKLKGKVDSLLDDFTTILKFKLKNKNFEKIYQREIVLTRNLDLKNSVAVRLDNVDARNVLRTGSRKTSYLNYVYFANNKTNNPEYFYIDRKETTKENQYIHILSVIKGKYKDVGVQLNEGMKIVNIIKGDFNLDDRDDYLILTTGKKRNYFEFFFCNEALLPLWGSRDNSVWAYESENSYMSVTGNILNFQKRSIDFFWLRHTSPELGPMMVPVVKHRGLIPEDDNTKDLLFFKFPSIQQRYFALTPELKDKKMIIKEHLVNDFNFEEKVKEELDILPWETVEIEGILKSDIFYQFKTLVSVGEGFLRKYYSIEYFSLDTFKIEQLSDKEGPILASNLMLPIDGKDANHSALLVLYDRSTARIAYLGKDGIVTTNIESEGWSDPYFGYLFGYFDGSYASFLESRYWVHFYQGDKKSKAAINRESSFPGIEFSEGLEGLLAKINGKVSPGIFVNSTLLYGDQLYAIVSHDEELKKPLSFSYKIPDNCSYMLPAKFEDSFYYFSLNCLESGKATLRFIPLLQEN